MNKKKEVKKIKSALVGEFHPTVLLEETVNGLVKNSEGVYLDATCGGGGHSLALLEKYPNIKLICSDWDLNAIKMTEKRLEKYLDRVTFIYGSLGSIHEIIKKSGYEKIDGVLADFGTSRQQIKFYEGFSFEKDSFLDMRMSVGFTKTIAADILEHASEKELAHIFYYYAEERASRKIAKAIVEERKKERIDTTFKLVKVIQSIVTGRGKTHPATKVFQALRIAVNKEFDQIQSFLKNIIKFIKPGGSIACISFHSIEDRLVKLFYKENKSILIKNNPEFIIASNEELKRNPSSRSAKLRIYYKTY